MKLNRVIPALVLAVFPVILSSASADTLALWTFETSMPSTSGPYTPEQGSGRASASIRSLPTDYGNLVGNGSAKSYNVNEWSVGDSWVFHVSTLNYHGVTVSFDQTSSGNGPGRFAFLYSTDSLNSWQVGPDYTVLANGASPNAAWSSGGGRQAAYTMSFDLSNISALDNQEFVTFELVNDSTTSANGGTVNFGGNSLVDNFLVSATPVPEPSTLALVGMGGFALLGFYRRRLNA